MQFKLYQFLTSIAGPFIDLYLMKRRRKGKEDAERFPERLGKPSFPRPSGPLVWVHAASVGEAMSVQPLIKSIIDNHSSVHVLVTTVTVTSAHILEKRLPKRTFHQYVPVDRTTVVRRFLKHWKPDFALWVESELWPNLIIETHKTGCPMVQVNATISSDSLKKWQRAKKLAAKMLGCFSLTLPQTQDDAKRLEELGAKNVQFLGNLKFDAPALPADPKATGELVNMISERQVWVAASTHDGEEEIIAGVHEKLKETHPSMITIIAPRHPERGQAIANMLKQKKLKYAVRSKEEKIEEDTDIYIADTVGELGLFYRLTGLVFIGGSLVPHGGHNPLEAARLECAIITGPYIDTFSRVYKELFEVSAAIKVADGAELFEQVDNLLVDLEAQEKYSEASLKLVESKSGVLDQYAEALTPYLTPFKNNDDTDKDDESA